MALDNEKYSGEIRWKFILFISVAVFAGAFFGGLASTQNTPLPQPMPHKSVVTSTISDRNMVASTDFVSSDGEGLEALREKCLQKPACKDRYLKSLREAGTSYSQAAEATPVIEIK